MVNRGAVTVTWNDLYKNTSRIILSEKTPCLMVLMYVTYLSCYSSNIKYLYFHYAVSFVALFLFVYLFVLFFFFFFFTNKCLGAHQEDKVCQWHWDIKRRKRMWSEPCRLLVWLDLDRISTYIQIPCESLVWARSTIHIVSPKDKNMFLCTFIRLSLAAVPPAAIGLSCDIAECVRALSGKALNFCIWEDCDLGTTWITTEIETDCAYS